MDEDATWYTSRPRPKLHCIRRGPSSTSAKEAQQPPSFRPMSMSIVAMVPNSVTAELLFKLLFVIFKTHRSTAHVDAAYCYRPRSVVCGFVGRCVTLVRLAKTAEPIAIPFWLWTRVGPGWETCRISSNRSRALTTSRALNISRRSWFTY